jgi:hypothetical protein
MILYVHEHPPSPTPPHGASMGDARQQECTHTHHTQRGKSHPLTSPGGRGVVGQATGEGGWRGPQVQAVE